MKTQTPIIVTTAFAVALFGATASAAGLSAGGQFASANLPVRSAAEGQPPRAYSIGADTTPVQTVVVKAHSRSQAPSSYEMHSLLVRAPVNPQVVRAQGE